MNSRLNDEVFHECMKPRYVERDEQKQYKALILNKKAKHEVIYIIAFNKAHAMEMLNDMQNIGRVLDIKEY